MEKYLDVIEGAGRKFYQQYHDKGKIVMLNLLKYKTTADYTDFDEINPGQISGKDAYQIYMDKTIPHLTSAGSKVIFFGSSKHFLIGPESETWDAVLLVEHKSVVDFIAFSQNEAYLKTAGHRTAALEDSRLLPIVEDDYFKSYP